MAETRIDSDEQGTEPVSTTGEPAARDEATSGAGVAGADVADAGAAGTSADVAGADVVGADVMGADVMGADVTEAGARGAGQMDEEAITTLNDLIHLDVDAIQAYRHAIDACDTVEIKEKLSEFMGDHERHVRDLRDAVRSLGSEPEEGRDLKGFFIEGFTAIVSQGDRSALLAMRGNEELTNRRYDAARSADVPESVRPVIERNYEDEVRHLAWIKEAISSRAWDTEPGAQKAA
jgi:uncharacterized protein (TIGR02284 family)